MEVLLIIDKGSLQLSLKRFCLLKNRYVPTIFAVKGRPAIIIANVVD